MNLYSDDLNKVIELTALPKDEVENFLNPYLSKFGKAINELTTEDIRLILSDIIHDFILNPEESKRFL